MMVLKVPVVDSQKKANHPNPAEAIQCNIHWLELCFECYNITQPIPTEANAMIATLAPTTATPLEVFMTRNLLPAK